MAGSYYYASPLGQSFSNLAQAVTGAGSKAGEAGVLGARQAYLEEQALNEVAQRQKIEAEAENWRMKNREMVALSRAADARRDALIALPNAPTAALPPEVNAPAPQWRPNFDTSTAFPPSGLGAAMVPEAPAAALPQTRADWMARYYADASRDPHIMKESPDFIAGYLGDINAVSPDAARPFTQEGLAQAVIGAGGDYGRTVPGFSADQARRAAEAQAQDATNRARYNQQDVTERWKHTTEGAGKAGSGVKAGKLTPGDENTFRAEATRRGGVKALEPWQYQAALDIYREEFAKDGDKGAASNRAMDRVWQTEFTPGKERTLWFDTEPTTTARFAFKDPAEYKAAFPNSTVTVAGGAAPPAAAAPAAAPAAAAPQAQPPKGVIVVRSKADVPANPQPGKTKIWRNGTTYIFRGAGNWEPVK